MTAVPLKKRNFVIASLVGLIGIALLISLFALKDPISSFQINNEDSPDHYQVYDNGTLGIDIYNTGKKLPFKDFMSFYPLADARAALASGNAEQIGMYRSLLLEYTFTYIQKPPLKKPNPSCTRPELPTPQCNAVYPKVFSGNRETLAKIGLAIQFGIEVDTLWIALEQYYGLVDKVFIIESTRAHKSHTKKPIVWDRIKNSPRFIKFSNMVVHMVIDDIPLAVDTGSIWEMEGYQETIRWKKFLEWNEQMKFFGDNDYIGFGDTDEVPSLESLNYIKHCQLVEGITSFDVGIWFPMGAVDDAFRPDFPIPGYAYTLGDPSFYTIKSAMEVGKTATPNRLRGRSGYAIVGGKMQLNIGMHMSNYAYLPAFYSKIATCTECPGFDYVLNLFEKVLNAKTIKEIEDDEYISSWTGYKDRMVKVATLDELNKHAVQLPWFLECNLDLFPAWSHIHDTRLDKK
ncbi:hypothetical protein HDV01_003191 [Terramyces sp. JEL0728]|nr:hypothetical protein HDV01_003191 [Terramyces sp. JEL0728]